MGAEADDALGGDGNLDGSRSPIRQAAARAARLAEAGASRPGGLGRVLRGSRRAVDIARNEGARSLAVKTLDRTRQRLVSGAPLLTSRHEIRMLVGYEDALECDWTQSRPWSTAPVNVRDRALTTAWIMHPPGESSGGAQNIFRFVKYLEDSGHRARIYLYHSAEHPIDAAYVRQLISASPSYPDFAAEFHAYDPSVGVAPDTDALFATGWETAYPAFRDPSPARRFYFVQDFEPSFYPVGSEHVLAENTYRFGFHGVTAGGWLSDKLSGDYGMRTSAFGFGADLRHYSFANRDRRDGVFFYARPVTTRRGFELGVMALQLVARANPDVPIHLAGWDISNYDLPFDHIDHGMLPITALNDIYNQCGVGLVLSLTNMSLLPLELLASGVIPILNRGENNDKVVQNDYIRYAEPTPHSLAAALLQELERPDLPEHAAKAAASVVDLSWDVPGREFVDIVVEAMRG